MNNFILELEKLNLGKIEKDISLSTLTTYKTGGIAKLVVYPNNINNLKQLLKLIHKYNIKYFILGKGSNTLFSDKEFNGVIIKLDKLNNFKIKQTEIYVESGMILSKLVQASIKNELTGLEFAIGIPGTIGGAEISTKHANFIINKNNASSSDILNLIKLVQKEVKDKYKIDLKLEQQLVNW